MKKILCENNLRQIIAALCIGTIAACAFSVYADKTEKDISSNVIRLHVIANSDGQYDQNLKFAVRDAVLDKTSHLFSCKTDISSVRAEIENNLDTIRNIAEETVKQEGYEYCVKVSLGNSDFPTKAYGNVTLPAGTYEALKIEIGAAEGKNWWCVMFPPLCFVDAATAQIPSDGMKVLKNNLTADEYSLITETDSLPVEVRFKVYEIWQTGKIKLKNMMASIK